MSLFVSFFIALLVTLAIFSFMRSLINGKQKTIEVIEIAATVELYTPEPEQPPEEELLLPEETVASNVEPQMEQLSAQAETPAPAMDAAAMPAMDIAPIEVTVADVGSNWAGTISSAAKSIMAKASEAGQDSKGYVEVTPYDTRQPNIPEVAWQNKINGWVLVVFNVAKNGHTKNVRVLDAQPKGIFEDEVVAAVMHWRYASSSLKKLSGEIVLTQKIQLKWQDFPGNIDY